LKRKNQSAKMMLARSTTTPIAIPAIAPLDKEEEEEVEGRAFGGGVALDDGAEVELGGCVGIGSVAVELATEVARGMDTDEETTWKPATELTISPVSGFNSAALSHVSIECFFALPYDSIVYLGLLVMFHTRPSASLLIAAMGQFLGRANVVPSPHNSLTISQPPSTLFSVHC
jgi:hypothetical protein